MECIACKTPNRPIAKYCKACGTAITTAQVLKPIGQQSAIQLDDLDGLVGLAEVKAQIKKQVSAAVNMRKAGFSYDNRNLYTILVGGSGTGKNRIVEVLASVLFKNGITTRADMKTIAAADFGEFARNLSANLDAAKGGILFIDHVHQLVPSGYQPGQSTPIDKLYAAIESRAADPIIVLASKEEGFREYLKANPEVNNRFNLKFYLPALTLDQMVTLAGKIIADQHYEQQEDFGIKLRNRLAYLFRNQGDAEQSVKIGKGGFLVNKEINNIISDHFSAPDPRFPPQLLLADDIKGEVYIQQTATEVLADLDDFVGMDNVKTFIRNLVNLVSLQQKDATITGKTDVIGAHIILTGNPGTGKTTLAKKLGEIFAASGILSSGHVVEMDRSKLVGQYVGETPLLVQKACDEAIGGVLFIDEAYTLVQNDQDTYGHEAIDTLIKRMEDDRGKFIMIAAGYERPMQNFIDANPGMKSRVKDNIFNLPDYNPAQLLQILKGFVKQGGYELAADAETKAAGLLEDMFNRRSKDFGNARDVRNFYEAALSKRAARINAAPTTNYDRILSEADLPGGDAVLPAGGIDEVLSALNKLTGLAGVKSEIAEMVDFLQGEKLRAEAGSKKMTISLHFVFAGNPGTGKTTVARILAKIFKGLGILPSDKLVEVTDKDLVSGYVGQTSAQTNKVIDSAMGGVLFIDEAYTLSKGISSGTGGFGSEAIDTLLKRMEDDRGKFIVIAAGYSKQMQDFLDSNPGLDSRFSKKITFDDYGPDELSQIMLSMIAQNGFTADDAAKARIKAYLADVYNKRDKRFANGRTVRNAFEDMVQTQSRRIVKQKNSGLAFNPMAIMEDDVPFEPAKEISPADALAELNQLIGLRAVKDEIGGLISFLEIEKMRAASGQTGGTTLNLHFIFKGKPGTGKTTVARILAKVFKALGVLPVGQLIETDRKDLVGQYVGHTAKQTSDVIDKAMGGVLFIDEAYTLIPEGNPNDFGKEAVDTLLKRMEDDKGKFIVIAAGYSGDMDRFVASNDGLASRFPKMILFEDYQPGELNEIFKLMLAKNGLSMATADAAKAMQLFEDMYRNRDNNFANGRTVRNLFEHSLEKQAVRLSRIKQQGTEISSMINEVIYDDMIV
ncbi:AAA family ATPase [Mucilaginibacter paludis]|uniref:AAA ATPase central domain protein n=1 Tax=Mucilaginibacter paludis DSM 18603 TaxID=714943 RepID=H1Y6U9_9SPHI|nr:AAA family ATPase [Mucilaginibacter paludis]EHQ28356.1 AAA ATPase central domain protein [Mucilaginibacter paludis DSM 18603]